jgi:hypothetical protein
VTYDDFTNAVMGDYRSFLSALTGLYLGVTTPGSTVSPQTLTNVSHNAHALAQTFFARADSEMTRYEATLSEEGNLSDVTRAGLRVAVAQNIKTVMKSLRGAQQSPAAMLKGASGGMGLLLQKKLGSLEYRVADARGRMFEATVLMRTTLRHFAIQTAIDAVVSDANRRGQDVVFIERADASPEGVSISGKHGYLSLEEARRRIFHPNTKAVLHV